MLLLPLRKATNYRQAIIDQSSLTSQIVKLSGSIIYGQLWEFLLNNFLSISYQHGSVNKKSCFIYKLARYMYIMTGL